MMLERIKRNKLIALIYRALHPSYSTCFICGLPWSNCKIHDIEMVKCTDEHCGEGFFPVCEYCWQHSEWEDIADAVIQLYGVWAMTQNKLPYHLQDMLDKAEEDFKNSRNDRDT